MKATFFDIQSVWNKYSDIDMKDFSTMTNLHAFGEMLLDSLKEKIARASSQIEDQQNFNDYGEEGQYLLYIIK